MRDEVWVFDRSLMRAFDVFHVALVAAAEDTLLPELYEVLGMEKMFDALDRFAGQVVRFPSKDILRRAVRDTTIYVSRQKGESRKDLAKYHDIPVSDIEEIETRMRGLIR